MGAEVTLAVVGGGIAGLAAAYRALEHLPAHRIALLEREAKLGGKIRTEQSDGFLLEAGPDSLALSNPWAAALCRDLGLQEELRFAKPEFARLYIKRDGRLHPLPWGIAASLQETLRALVKSELLSTAGLLRAACEYFLPPRREPGDESIANFFSRRFGGEFYRWLVEPLAAGIYGGNAPELSLEAALPELRKMELHYGSVLGGLLWSGVDHGAGRSAPAPRIATLKGGLERLVKALEQRLRGTVLLNSTGVTRLVRREGRYALFLTNGGSLTADAVVLATPAPAAAAMVEDLDPALADLLRTIRFAPSVVVSVAFHEERIGHGFDGYGYLCPRAEGGPVRAVTWMSNKFPDRTPAGAVLIRASMREPCSESLEARGGELVLRAVLAELRGTLGIRSEPLFWRVHYWDRGIAQYAPGHRGKTKLIRERLLHHPGLYVAGSSYDGVGIPYCIASGFRAADEACGDREPVLGRSTPPYS
ncbi:Protoporphyrinogen oxidase [bacterium HR33]|nr:Protoporphyrinogen oxidase [bacterium HR33]